MTRISIVLQVDLFGHANPFHGSLTKLEGKLTELQKNT